MDTLPFYLSYAALWILIILHSLVLLGVVRIVYQLQNNSSASHNTGMSAGEEAPAFDTVDLYGISISSADFADQLTALLFVSPDCKSCTTILEEDMEYLKFKAQGNVIVVCRAGPEVCTRMAERYGLDVPIVADEDNEISELYRISAVPTTVLINADKRIQSYGQPWREGPEESFGKALQKEIEGAS